MINLLSCSPPPLPRPHNSVFRRYYSCMRTPAGETVPVGSSICVYAPRGQPSFLAQVLFVCSTYAYIHIYVYVDMKQLHMCLCPAQSVLDSYAGVIHMCVLFIRIYTYEYVYMQQLHMCVCPARSALVSCAGIIRMYMYRCTHLHICTYMR